MARVTLVGAVALGVLAVSLVAQADASSQTAPGRNGVILFAKIRESGSRAEPLFSVDPRSRPVRRIVGLSSLGGASFSPDGLRLATAART